MDDTVPSTVPPVPSNRPGCVIFVLLEPRLVLSVRVLRVLREWWWRRRRQWWMTTEL